MTDEEIERAACRVAFWAKIEVILDMAAEREAAIAREQAEAQEAAA